MIEILLSFVIFLLVILGMSIGLMRGRGGIEGSCGGLNKIPGIEPDCGGTCHRPCKRRRERQVSHNTDSNRTGHTHA